MAINEIGNSNYDFVLREYEKTGGRNVGKAEPYAETAKTAKANYGATLGKPQLSEAGAKYYEELKNKFKDMDFVLVSKDMIDVAKNNASSYGNKNRMVVLIDEEKIEKMATDDAFRQQYEGLISTAQSKMPVLQQMMANNPNVKTIGMQVGNDGRASFFAVMDKSAKDMQARIEEKRAAKKEAAKAEAKKEAKAKQKERIEESRAERAEARKKLEGDEEEDYDILMADSIEDLLGMIEEWNGTFREATPEDEFVGQNFDFSA
ncbi:MAG: hypothetical protein IK016_02095 [Lachnospiraceae bacterium]|nr:hypothetical protein [Lachnospiraceae bacterium]